MKHILKLKGTDDKTALYLINYENGGFAIVSADKRESPILAYSELIACQPGGMNKRPEGLLFGLAEKSRKSVH